MQIIKIDPVNYKSHQLDPAAQVLAKGGLVAFPTETIYGLGVNADIPESVARLIAIKKSPPNRPFTFHLADIDDIYRYITNLPRLAHRLIRHLWPGPLTLVLQGPDNKWIGVRLPDHQIAQDLIKLSGVSVIAPSANLADNPPPREARQVFHNFPTQIDIAIDDGPTRYGKPSTVVQVMPNNKWEILRQGVIAQDQIAKLAYQVILFVCTGNSCRSPMAVGLFRQMLAEKLGLKESNPVLLSTKLEQKGYKIISGGTAAIYNNPPTLNAIEAMKEFDVNISDHTSQPATITMVEEADQVYVMTKSHLATLKEWIPDAVDKVRLIDPKGKNIADPIGGGLEVYRNCAQKIKKGLEAVIVTDYTD